MVWSDPRLGWNKTTYPDVDFLSWFASPSQEETSIWTPSFELLNQAGGGFEGLSSKRALNLDDGTVLWRRNGALTANCAFSGLESMPFGDLNCELVLGGWTDFYGKVEFKPIDVGFPCSQPGLSFGQAPGRLTAYQEYSMDCKRSTFRTINTTIDFGIQMQYQVMNIYFNRATLYYVLRGIVPSILLTYLR